jgi:hypothetical protein
MIVSYWINRRQFDKKIAKFLKKEKAQVEALEDSTSPVEDNQAKNINLRKKFNVQDEEISVGDSLIDRSTTQSQLETLADDGDPKKRYSIEMIEQLIQTVVKQQARLSQLESKVMHLS